MNKTVSDKHAYPGFTKDYDILYSVLHEAEVFSVQPQRRHSSFHMTQGLMSAFDPDKFITWIKGHIQKHDQLSIKEQVID